MPQTFEERCDFFQRVNELAKGFGEGFDASVSDGLKNSV